MHLTRTKLLPCALIAALCLLAVGTAPAEAARKKAIWGPPTFNGKSMFPTYKKLGVGIYQLQLPWYLVATTKPVLAQSPKDPNYKWPAEIGYAVRQAKKHKIRVMLQIFGTPGWANGNRQPRWAPKRATDLKAFAMAAARKYPYVKHWQIWGEPTRKANFMPLLAERRKHPLTKKQRRGPQKYAQMLDASYGGLKKVSRRNLVIGGNTFVTGDVSPKNWIRFMRLPNGRKARMDLWGHNPFGYRRPDLRLKPLGEGFVDFGALDTMAKWLDKHQGRRNKKLKIFISEYTIPSDHQSHEFNYWATREAQARYIRLALRIARRWKRIYTMGWFAMFDEAPRSDGLETNRGLMTYKGKRKPAFYAYKRN